MHIDTCTYMHVRSREQEEKKALKFDEIHKIGHFLDAVKCIYLAVSMCYVQNTFPHSSPAARTSDEPQGRSSITAAATGAEAKRWICFFRLHVKATHSWVRGGDCFTLLQKAQRRTNNFYYSLR